MLKPSRSWRNLDNPIQFQTEPEPINGDRLLILVPHCDDETLGTGGIIWSARQRGLPVKIVFLTNGDGSRSTQLAENAKKLRRNTFLQLARMRQKEALAACAELGVSAEDVLFLGYPDRGTGQMWFDHWAPGRPFRSPFTRADCAPYDNAHTPFAAYCGRQAWQDVRNILAAFRPTRVYTTHPNDTHPDHWASWAYALAALESLRVDPSEKDWARKTKLLAFLVHRGIWPRPHGYRPAARLTPPPDLRHGSHALRQWTSREVNAAASAAKKLALGKYVSQMAFTPHYLRGFLRLNELFEHIPPIDPTEPAAIDGKHPQASETGEPAHGVWLVDYDPQHIRLRLHLRQRDARRQLRLHLHVFGLDIVRAWSVEIRGNAATHSILARDADSGHTEEWGLVREGHDLDILIPRRVTHTVTHSSELTGGEVRGTAGAAPIASPEMSDVAILVAAAAHRGTSILDRTEIGAIRISSECYYGESPLLIAPSDPRYRTRQMKKQSGLRRYT
jgi:LmbE family N-acetylglucosaminyl deacetylase